MHFDNKVYASFPFFNQHINITSTNINTWFVFLLLFGLTIVVRIRISKFKDVPSGFQNFVELIVETMDGFVKENMGEKYAYFANYFFGVFAFIMLSNLSALIGLRPATADLATTAAFGAITFVLIHFIGITQQKGEYFKSYLHPIFLFLPMNIVGALATPISLSFRLFGNILGGLIIMSMVYSLLPKALTFVIPAPLHFYFDTFVGCLQAFIFVILSMTFIKEKIPE